MRFGIVGAGNIGQIRAKALQNADGCELTAVADVDAERAGALAASANAAVFTDYSQMLASDVVDAVVVSTPPPLHEDIVVSALEAGKHVLCEKPLSNSIDAARRMVETSRRTGCVLATGFNFRYVPAFKFLKDTLDSGVIGELDHVRAFAGHVGLTEFHAPWEYDKNVVGGGALMDIGIHMIDLTRYALGDVSQVFGMATNNVWNLGESEDNGFALMQSSEGKMATLHATWSEWKGYRFQIEAYGNKGMVRAQYGPMTSMVIYADEPGGKRQKKTNFYPMNIVQEKLHGWQRTIERSFQGELVDFVKFAQEGKNGTLADGFAGFRAVEIANAIYQSTQEKQPVYLTEPF